MLDVFEVAFGSVIGRNHVLGGKNNQDALRVIQKPGATIAVVCDGSSSGIFSEFGAQLGARFIAHHLDEALSQNRPLDHSLERARQDLIAQIRLMART